MRMRVLILVLGSLLAGTSRATTIAIDMQVDGGGFIAVASSAGTAVGPVSVVIGGVFEVGNISGSAASGNDLLSSALSVTLLTSGTHTLTIATSSDGYTSPAGPSLLVQSGEGGTYVSGTSAVTFQAFADKNNALRGMGDFTAGLQTAVPPSGSATTFATGEALGLFTRLATPYSLTSITEITMTGVGATANFANHVIVTMPVPEPSVVSLVGLGLLGLFAGRRRLV